MNKFEDGNKQFDAELQQLEELKCVGLLASSVIHSFNNTIGVIRGYTDLLLKDTSLSDRSRVFVKHIMGETDVLEHCAEKLRIFTKQKKYNFQLINIQSIIERSIEVFRKSLVTPIEIQLDISAVHAMILADIDQIQQAVMNLCNNACDVMRENGGILKIVLKEVDIDTWFAENYEDLNEGKYVKLTVSDTGCGIDQKMSKQIFEPFFTHNKTGENAGLGLSVVRAIVKIHKGEITVESKIGEGTVFDVYLPLVDKDHRNTASP